MILAADDATPLGLGLFSQLDPRVAARRGNPGLSYITASRFSCFWVWRVWMLNSI